MSLVKVELKRMIAPMKEGAAVFLGNEQKTFMMFIGHHEAAAIIREFQGQKYVRPLTHDLFHYAMLGFNIEIKRVIISSLNGNTFFATLLLEQKVTDDKENWTGKRNEVRIDARPSDSIIMALKARCEIFVSEEVMTNVKDVAEEIKQMPLLNFETPGAPMDFEHFQFGGPDETESGEEDPGNGEDSPPPDEPADPLK